jgi:Tfp pilus assembly protein PilF
VCSSDLHQTIEWMEWWYPVHGIDGYEFATRDVAINVIPGKGEEGAAIRLIGSGTWKNAECLVGKDGEQGAAGRVDISPLQPATMRVKNQGTSFTITVRAEGRTLASFVHPLPLPKREPPDKVRAGLSALAGLAKNARDCWADGILADKQSKPDEARKDFEKALDKDPAFAPAHLALAVLDLEAGLPQAAKPHLEKILERDNDSGPAHYYLARALLELDDEAAALEHAWRAVRDPASDAIGLGVAGEIYIRQQRWAEAIAALERAVAKDEQDILNRNLLTVAYWGAGRGQEALEQVRHVLQLDPLDAVALAAENPLSGRGNFPEG